MGWEPQQLKARHFLAAALQAMGMTQTEVASTVGLTISYLSTLSQSALFQAEVRRLTLQLQSKLVNDAARRLERELTKNIDTMIEVRDRQDVGAAVRLRAANDLMDHVPGIGRKAPAAQEAQLQFTESQTQAFLLALGSDEEAAAAFHNPPASQEEKSLFDLVETMIKDPDTQEWDPQIADIVIHEA